MQAGDYKGQLILMMAPMGSGKGMLVRHIKEKHPEVYFSVSCTTRAPRPGDTNGVEYYFLSHDEFRQKIDNDEFIEWAEFGGNTYGTLKSEIVDRLKAGQIVLTEIEIQGVEILKNIIPSANRTIVYIDAGDWEVLKKRALGRAPMSEEELSLRHERFQQEVKAKPLADVIISNLDGHMNEAKQAIDDLLIEVSNKINL